MKLVLIGGHPKGFQEPFHIKTKSGKILRTITQNLKMNPIFFDLWNNQKEEDVRKLSKITKKKLLHFTKNGYTLIALGRYIEEALINNDYTCIYLPHPASRDEKYITILKSGLKKMK